MFGQRIAPVDGVLPLHEGGDLGAHHVVAQLQGRIVLLVPIGAGAREFLQRGDALGRHRMRLQIGIGAARGEQAVVGEALEGFVHALGGLAGRGQELHAGAVGVFFLLALIGEQGAADHFLRRGDRGGAGIGQAAVAVAASRARHHRAGAEQHGDDHLGLRLRQLLAHLGEMAAGEMAGFVREHADDLVRRLRLHHRAVIHEDAAAVGDESVEGALVDDHHLDVLLLEAGGAQDRPRIVAQQLLGLGVAQDRRTLVLLRQRGPSARSPSATAVVSAVSFEVFLRSAMRSNMKRSLNRLAAARIPTICPNKPPNTASLGR